MQTMTDIAPRREPPQLEAATMRAVTAFRRRIDAFHPSRLLLFGSQARGSQNSDSDADVAVVLSGESGDRWSIARDMARAAFDVLLETDVLIDPFPLWESELLQPDHFINPSLIRVILRDGVPV